MHCSLHLFAPLSGKLQSYRKCAPRHKMWTPFLSTTWMQCLIQIKSGELCYWCEYKRMYVFMLCPVMQSNFKQFKQLFLQLAHIKFPKCIQYSHTIIDVCTWQGQYVNFFHAFNLNMSKSKCLQKLVIL